MSPPTDSLKLHVRRIHEASGEVRETHSVACPRRGATMTAEQCFRCEHLVGIGSDGGRFTLSCFAAEDAQVESVSSLAQTPVSMIMTRDVDCVRPEVSVEAVTNLMLAANISGLPVVDAAGRPLGVVSKTDLLRAARDEGRTPAFDREELAELKAQRLERGFHVEHESGVTVKDVMTPLDFSLHEGATVAQASALMAFEGVHRVPVLSTSGQVVGIVSSMDVLRFIGQLTGYLR